MLCVKASPEIGRTHGETVCVAGIRLDRDRPEWIRLFPVPWEWFWGREHPKYQVVEVDVAKHDRDQRPESFRPRLETATVVRNTSTAAERAETLNQLPQYTMCDLVAAKGWSRPSLGLVVPTEITSLSWDDHSSEPAHAAKMNRAAQGSLLAQGAPRLEFPTVGFKLGYRCSAECPRGHEQTIVDWEITEAWRTWRGRYPEDYLDRIRDKWLGLLDAQRAPALFVGNQHQAPQGFLVLGIARDIKRGSPQPTGPAREDESPRSIDDIPGAPPQSTEARLFDP